MQIRKSIPSDIPILIDLWLAAVRATHHFLSEGEIQRLLPAVKEYIENPGHTLWVACMNTAPIGFMGLQDCAVKSLFIAPKQTRLGAGSLLLTHARAMAGDRLTVDVNEQNTDALAFYIAAGFGIVGHSSEDAEGRPYPLVHLRENLPSCD